MFPDNSTMRASHETNYTSLCDMQCVDLLIDVLAKLKQGCKARSPQMSSEGRRNKIHDMIFIH
jgi:hypothetical protein